MRGEFVLSTVPKGDYTITCTVTPDGSGEPEVTFTDNKGVMLLIPTAIGELVSARGRRIR